MTTIRTADYAADIPWLLSSTGDVSIAVAYVSKEGLDIVKPQIEALLRDSQQVRFLIDLHSGNTDPSAVWSLVELQDSHEGMTVKTLLPDKDGGNLHAKLYLSKTRDEVNSIVGSGNLTGAALSRNAEYGVVLKSPSDSRENAMLLGAFESLWNKLPSAHRKSRSCAAI